jgi:DNA-binding winged helix-turn-helix (wHTH) protein/tetratricopeptide (TPR) repeat protein
MLMRLGKVLRDMKSPDHPVLQFGPFDADLREGQLRKHGIRIRLQAQPFRILDLLLRHPGELVTRDEIRKTVWPENTYVDFENGMNRAMNRLRTALNDNAAVPRYVETVSGRGYRFIAPVRRFSSEPPRKVFPILGVLPIRNLSGQATLEYLCDGLTDELIFELARIPGLRTLARTTMFRFKDSAVDIEKLAKDLHLDAILFSELAVENADAVVLRAELVDSSGAVLCGDRISASLRDLASAKNRIAQIVREKLAPSQRIDVRSSSSSDAYRVYLQGRFYWNRRTKDGFQRAIECFNKAISSDPQFAPAYSGLADVYALLSVSPYCVLRASDAMPKARRLAQQALELDATLASAHATLALVHFYYEWNLQAGEAEFRRAVELDPAGPTIRQWYSLLLMAQNRMEEARSEAAFARSLDPLSPTANSLAGITAYFDRDPKVAVAELASLSEVEPTNAMTWIFLGMGYIGIKALDKAESAFQQSLSVSPENTMALAGLGYAWAKLGQESKVHELLRKLEAMAQERYVPPQVYVFIYLGLEKYDLALEWLERSVDERCDFVVYLGMDPAFDTIRSYPRFQKLLSRLRAGG